MDVGEKVHSCLYLFASLHPSACTLSAYICDVIDNRVFCFCRAQPLFRQVKAKLVVKVIKVLGARIVSAVYLLQFASTI